MPLLWLFLLMLFLSMLLLLLFLPPPPLLLLLLIMMKMMRWLVVVVVLLLLFIFKIRFSLSRHADFISVISNSFFLPCRLPPCAACTTLVQSFDKNAEKAAKKSSSPKLDDVLSGLCLDAERGERQCLDNKEEWADNLVRSVGITKQWNRLPRKRKKVP